ncbi:hypothetical protein AX774_g4171 [Zancudomyces culisetae]|uniref:Uncharacterized protein n=1 Tax=Zancudomyces culisetae TaxID=1213189 RepID=A0A1R1PN14_ZANCU|nr:hypothetical protein AX774_g4171 [Zancudomyces culisetae]|eukprot:OMH82348.1 hypothetical protein AX774_g4171 [Zancudomyces culisetae]
MLTISLEYWLSRLYTYSPPFCSSNFKYNPSLFLSIGCAIHWYFSPLATNAPVRNVSKVMFFLLASYFITGFTLSPSTMILSPLFLPCSTKSFAFGISCLPSIFFY